ncbi:DNA-directed RNA polymerase subunit epsilon [Limosilactobacillus equigenerosi]|uniref:DNA-directed RNA polymerase subunit epsilon n=1 Tax=Limosilactobacillus equigenerosi DSM 18793 = JCM 14505 TaxID=1423742 RepID=A0A0R1UYN5_9LACO|nr:DNA-directed RNA polymerase subunit epsilon [Limosilactobacillus equigenerosi]KRL95986.1 hypothetical protein FC21_GL000683 [Limosilactobacillus equigenerosi DSM 18793 = JCM 14505]
MTFKIYFQETKTQTPRRESTKSIYIEAASLAEARKLVETKTDYNIELIQALDDATLAYEQKSPDFQITTL